MYPLNLIGPLTLALAGLASATCSTTGEKAPEKDRNTMKTDPAKLHEVCTRVNGIFEKTQDKTHCLQFDGGSYNFQVVYTGDPGPTGTVTLSEADCIREMTKEVGCDNGGETAYPNWRYKVSYAKGSCPNMADRSFDQKEEKGHHRRVVRTFKA